MTTAQIYSNNNNQFQRRVYKAYMKCFGMLLPGLRPMVVEGQTSGWVSPVMSDFGSVLELQRSTRLGYTADGIGLPGPVGDRWATVAGLQG